MSWNQGRAEIDRLLADGELQRVPPNREHADQLFSQARKDLASAELLLDANPKRAYESLYDAARMALTCWRHGEQTFAWNWRFRGRRCLPRRGRGGPSHRGHGWRGGLPGSPRPAGAYRARRHDDQLGVFPPAGEAAAQSMQAARLALRGKAGSG
jgi:hypothetical protein